MLFNSVFTKNLIVLTLVTMLVSQGVGQETPSKMDSLKSVYETTESDSVRVEALSEIGSLQARVRDTESNHTFQTIIKLCDSLLREEVGHEHYFKLKTYQAKSALGVNHYLVGNYPAALQLELDALNGFEEIGEKGLMGRCLVVMGAIYKHQGDLNAAKGVHTRALALETETGNTRGKALALINVGIILQEQDSAAKAIEYYTEGLNTYVSAGDKRGEGVGLINLGSAYKKLKKLDSAEYYFRKSLHLREEINDLQGLLYSNARLGEVLLAQKKGAEALEVANRSLKLADEIKHIRGVRDAHELLSQTLSHLGDYKEALRHFKLFVIARDSMSDADAIREVTKAQSEFAFKRQKTEDSVRNAEAEKVYLARLDLQEARNQQQQQRLIFLIVGLILVVLVSLLIVRQNQKTKSQKKTIEQQKLVVEENLDAITKRDEEKELLLKEIHHRVKNNLQVVSSLLELQSKKGDESAQTAFADGQSRVRAMALIHEKLYRNDNIASIDFAEYIEQLSGQIASLYNSKKVDVVVDAKGYQFDIDTAVPLGLILNELITNAFKYAFSETGGQLRITVHSDADKGYTLSVSDNGNGMPADFDFAKAKSLGLRLVKRLSRQLYGKAVYENNNGTEFRITFKDTLQRKEVA